MTENKPVNSNTYLVTKRRAGQHTCTAYTSITTQRKTNVSSLAALVLMSPQLIMLGCIVRVGRGPGGGVG